MTVTVAIEEKPQYLKVKLTGERATNDLVSAAKKFWLKIEDICRIKGINHVLVVSDLQGEMPIMAAYEIGESIVATTVLRKNKNGLHK